MAKLGTVELSLSAISVAPEAQWASASLDALVLQSAARHADRTALWVDGCAFSYRELIERAAGIAGALPGRGVDDVPPRCAVLGARSLSAFAGVLGAVLARNVYVPLNPRHPPERLAATVSAAQADALVVDERAAGRAAELLAQVERSLVVLMPEAATPPDWALSLKRHRFLCRSDLETRAAPSGIAPRDPRDGAYLLFTSGSTGAPKGVLVSHGNVTTYLRGVAERYAPLPEDRFSQLFDLTFDLSVHDMFLCWGAGGALYCPPESAKMAPRDFVRRNELTFWFSTPSTAAFMLRARMLRPDDFPALRWSLFCGEALPKRVAEAFAAAAPNSVLENLYGPTEATIAITAYRMPTGSALAGVPDIVPIGEPLPGQAAVVLDPDGRAAEPGVEGELCLGGAQVTQGYWRRPDLTAERFAPPLAGSAGDLPDGRWYRTGDRARYAAEHGLLFLGRLDRQVKIAGHRVELQEVEAALRRAAGCESVAAIAWPLDADGLARGLIGFVGEESAGDETIMEACRQILPPYMAPSRLLRVADWPVNDNGKTDYAGLRRMVE